MSDEKPKTVESQEGRPVYGMVKNSAGTFDRLRLAQPGTVFAWDEERWGWVECRLLPIKGGMEQINELAKTGEGGEP